MGVLVPSSLLNITKTLWGERIRHLHSTDGENRQARTFCKASDQASVRSDLPAMERCRLRFLTHCCDHWCRVSKKNYDLLSVLREFITQGNTSQPGHPVKVQRTDCQSWKYNSPTNLLMGKWRIRGGNWKKSTVRSLDLGARLLGLIFNFLISQLCDSGFFT